MKNLIRDLLQLFPAKAVRKFSLLLVLIMAASLVEALGVGIIPLFVLVVMSPSKLAEHEHFGFLFHKLPAQASLELIIWASAILLIFIVLKGLFLAFVYYVQARVVNFQRVSLQSRMFRIYQKAPYDWHLQRGSSEILNNVQRDTQQVVNGLVLPMLDLVMGLSMCLFVAVAILIGTPPVAMLGVAILGVGLATTLRFFKKKLRATGDVLRRENTRMIQAIQQGFGALVDARIVGCEAYLAQSFDNSARKQAQAETRRLTVMRVSPVIIETLAITCLLLVSVLLFAFADDPSEVAAPLSLLAVAVVRLKAQAGRIATAINTINGSRSYLPGILEDLQQIERFQAQRSPQQNLEWPEFEALELQQVSYQYPNTETAVVQQLSLSLKQGESIAFVGETGCGKSTLVNVILGLLQPQSGSVSVNGQDIYANLHAWRKMLGYIPQTIFLIDDSIRANIAFGVPAKEVNQTKLQEVIEAACLADFVASQSEGLDTEIGERGVRLSGGQRQRIGIARALYFEPQLLILDEATSALDNATEIKVMQAIENAKKNRTLIMIAHRLTSIENCDRVITLNNGRVVG
ncbi:ABC transporter ATP-binding protein [Rubritalea marina]|uniref:ABC transporter ATP-binding protein n=1 Tax=Rubritalea marina TaxID=361055 RepID=UPI0009FD47BE|nr:ABC transporter ATP-binding protein [Rubritalea marina]